MADDKKRLDEIVPEWAEQSFVPETNEFMAAALGRTQEMERQHPEVSNPTAVSISKNGKLVVLASGGQIHPSFCPRIALTSPSGTEYEFCPDHCAAVNHAESRAARAAKDQGVDVAGCEAFLAGHYWACKPCWDALHSVGITRLRLVDGALARYKDKRGALSPNQGKLPRTLRVAMLGALQENFSKFKECLLRVGFQIEESIQNVEVVVMLAGAPVESVKENGFEGVIVSAEDVIDYRILLTRLSQATERLFENNS